MNEMKLWALKLEMLSALLCCTLERCARATPSTEVELLSRGVWLDSGRLSAVDTFVCAQLCRLWLLRCLSSPSFCGR